MLAFGKTVNVEDELLKARLLRGQRGGGYDPPVGDPESRVRSRLLAEHGPLLAHAATDRGQVADELRSAIRREVEKEREYLPSAVRAALVERLNADLLGLGLLDEALEDPEVTDVLVNRFDAIFVRRGGRCYRFPSKLPSEESLLVLAEKLANEARRPLTAETPSVLIATDDGLRVRLMRPPLTPSVALAIRKPAAPGRLGPAELIAAGAWTEELATFIQLVVQARFNLLFHGPTGSGKTTALRAAVGLLTVEALGAGADGSATRTPRCVVLEHTPELNLPSDEVLALHAVERPGGKGISLYDLFPAVMQLLPEVIVLGEILHREALPFLNAALSGHQCFATIHAGTAAQALWRLAMLVQGGGIAEMSTAKELLGHSLDFLVEHRITPDGRRIVAVVAEMTATGLHDLFRLEQGRLERVAEVSSERLRRLVIAGKGSAACGSGSAR